jgi:hypothetical protein
MTQHSTSTGRAALAAVGQGERRQKGAIGGAKEGKRGEKRKLWGGGRGEKRKLWNCKIGMTVHDDLAENFLWAPVGARKPVTPPHLLNDVGVRPAVVARTHEPRRGPSHRRNGRPNDRHVETRCMNQN